MKTTISLRIDPDIKEQIGIVAKEHQQNLSDFLRDVIVSYLHNYLEDEYPVISENTIVIDLSNYDFD
ncbi:hypothetical protein [Mesoflavibacter zeaxanthinifaciens]|uniref:hypothetical protein n=1 Tax=Mesoflavibacter zeaxanthinifaciens TaxID=393060 RepID=UPI003A8DA819